jgi:hypothetical protein
LRWSENRILRRIFGAKIENGTGSWREQHNEKVHDLYSSSVIIITTTSDKMRWENIISVIEMRKTASVV